MSKEILEFLKLYSEIKDTQNIVFTNVQLKYIQEFEELLSQGYDILKDISYNDDNIKHESKQPNLSDELKMILTNNLMLKYNESGIEIDQDSINKSVELIIKYINHV